MKKKIRDIHVDGIDYKWKVKYCLDDCSSEVKIWKADSKVPIFVGSLKDFELTKSLVCTHLTPQGVEKKIREIVK